MLHASGATTATEDPALEKLFTIDLIVSIRKNAQCLRIDVGRNGTAKEQDTPSPMLPFLDLPHGPQIQSFCANDFFVPSQNPS
jgi:hypothetical protein